MNRFDWGFGKAPHGQDGGGRQANVMAWNGLERDSGLDEARGDVLARVIYLTRVGPAGAYSMGARDQVPEQNLADLRPIADMPRREVRS
jgi:hypothetical protein